MSDDDQSTYTGTVLVTCRVLVKMGGETMGDMGILRTAAEHDAKMHIVDALNDAGVKRPIAAANVVDVEAAQMTITWPGDES